ncbi:type I-U CRISPR-associated protein Csb2 [Dokdonella sp.]|uniref:type I-G CRISPR-associated protein Csb2 n=1 Tax=Dokdonella sp. TaxID=2291710 RepID=UPI0031C83ECE|nr:type I-U CRISPR-associated protein Csb2 [Dokdonella sp.]
MLAIRLRFPAGRYHATPWGRHVNEADVEWPPSPWRLLRALVATWHRKLDADRFSRARLVKLIEHLCETLPVYQLPPAVRAHTRHYMPVREGSRDKPVLIFDAFVHLQTDAELIMAWPQMALDDSDRELLHVLLDRLGFLGRAESWVEANMLDDWQGVPNCVASELCVDMRTGEVLEPVQMIAPLSAGAWQVWRREFIDGTDWSAMKAKSREQLRATLPERLCDAMSLDTADLQAVGWSRPPASQFVTYQRPLDCFAPSVRTRRPFRPIPAQAVRLALQGKPLPRIEDALRIGELVRKAALKSADRLGLPIPPVLSGHDLPAENRHAHAFYLPEDADHDGHIDHLTVYSSDGLDANAVAALASVQRLWQRDGSEWRVLFEGSMQDTAALTLRYLGTGLSWESATPYLRPWHAKSDFGVAEQIQRECHLRGLPKPQVEILPTITINGRQRRPIHFHRFRNRRGLQQPDRQGSFLRLTFPEPVQGPLAFGFGCHFGLGLFAPTELLADRSLLAPLHLPHVLHGIV